MRITAILTGLIAVTGLGVGGVMAGEIGEMEMDMGARLMGRQKSGGGGTTARATSTNLQVFTGALGGAAADPIVSSGDSTRPFKVGSDTFTDFKSAFTRSCNNQHNACAEIANGKNSGGLTVSQCDGQQSSCTAALNQATTSTFPTLFSSDAKFDYFCDP